MERALAALEGAHQADTAALLRDHQQALVDAEDRSRVGHHRFEQFVRHTLAPSLATSHGFYRKVLLSAYVVGTGPAFDTMCSDVFTEYHLLSVTTSGIVQ